ncbi:MAG: DUF2163 domain-containing protein [Rickettsia endosymbiont of Sergentomyia squamirostris]|uniref:DUF2163 domain-containing protein n=1 Tax=Candidatus Tisiphia endosymbiont of Sergentomyia squamirostris TaxID=3113639 RepID=A0AAT9G987_9RICK
MRNLPPTLTHHLKSEVTSLATCWKITRLDKIILGFTDYDQNLLIDDLQYESIASFTPSNVESSSNMAVDNLDLSGQIFTPKINASDLLAGKYDFAEVEIFLVNYQEPNSGKLIQKRGILGEVTLNSNMFCAEIRGLTQFLSQTMCETYLPHCRANLGDTKCKFNLQQPGFTVEETVSRVIDQQSFFAQSLNQPNGWFTGGYVIWYSGSNHGLKMEVKDFADTKITLALPMPFAISVSDKFAIMVGCDKSSETCIEKFQNIVNFRGEPDLPGIDRLMSTAGTRRSN